MTTITCERCGQAKHRGRCKGKAADKTLAEVVEKRVSKPKPVKLNGHLEVAQTYGFRAAWEDGFLAIEQDQVGDDGEAVTARLLLTKDDVARISEWAGS